LSRQSNQKRARFIIRQLADFRTFPPHNHAKPRAAHLSPLIVRAGTTRQKVLLCPSLPHHPPPFCLILAEAVLLTEQGQRFFTFLLKLCHCEELAWACGLEATWQSQGMPFALFRVRSPIWRDYAALACRVCTRV